MFLFRLLFFLVSSALKVVLLIFLSLYAVDNSQDLLHLIRSEASHLEAHQISDYLRSQLHQAQPLVEAIDHAATQLARLTPR